MCISKPLCSDPNYNYFNINNGKCVQIVNCPDGYKKHPKYSLTCIKNNGSQLKVLAPCDTNSILDSGLGLCISIDGIDGTCPNNSFLNNTQCTILATCPSGTNIQNGICV